MVLYPIVFIRPERAKAYIRVRAFALSGRIYWGIMSQGDALGYVLVGLSARLSRK